eukprot:5928517-Amphidinium_carterae.1
MSKTVSTNNLFFSLFENFCCVSNGIGMHYCLLCGTVRRARSKAESFSIGAGGMPFSRGFACRGANGCDCDCLVGARNCTTTPAPK